MRLFLIGLLVVVFAATGFVVNANVQRVNAEIKAENDAKAAAEAAEKAALRDAAIAALTVKVEAAQLLLSSEVRAFEDAVREGNINKANAASLRAEAEKIATELAEFKAEAERRIAVSEQQIAELNAAARTREGYAEEAALKAATVQELVTEYRAAIEALQNEIASLAANAG